MGHKESDNLGIIDIFPDSVPAQTRQLHLEIREPGPAESYVKDIRIMGTRDQHFELHIFENKYQVQSIV